MIKHPSIGSVSHGTMRSEDLMSSFSSVLEDFIKSNPDDEGNADRQELIDSANALYERFDDDELTCEQDDALQDEVDGVVPDLFDALDEIAPPYCTFGAHEGDGSDYGFWPYVESMENDVREGELLKVNDLADIPAGHNGSIMLVNDHGNVTLLEPVVTYREVWSIV